MWDIFWVYTLTRLKYQVRPSDVLFALRLLKFLENPKRKIYGTDNHVIAENIRVTESNTLEQKGEVRSIHQ